MLAAIHGTVTGLVILAVLAQLLAASKVRNANTADVVRWARRGTRIATVLPIGALLQLLFNVHLVHDGYSPTDEWLVAGSAFVILAGALPVVVLRPWFRSIPDHRRSTLPCTVALGCAALMGDLVYLFEAKPPASAVAHSTLLALTITIAGGVTAWRRHSEAAPSRARRRWRVAAVLLGAIALAGAHSAWRSSMSELPDVVAMTGHSAGTPVNELTGGKPLTTPPRIRLEAKEVVVGDRPMWTFGGTVPGRMLTMRQGMRIDVELVNHLPVPTSIHWHGIDLAGAYDGVPGVTQDAVAPGDSFVYSFTPPDSGTYWYHSHQNGLEQLDRGLFGIVVVEPAQPSADNGVDVDEVVSVHTWSDGRTDLFSAGFQAQQGDRVRLRLVNTDSKDRVFDVSGAPFRITARDGHAVGGGAEVRDAGVPVSAGGRVDLLLTTQAMGIRVTVGDQTTVLGSGMPPALGEVPLLDLDGYGEPRAGAISSTAPFDKLFDVTVDGRLGWYDGGFGFQFTVNGALFPHSPMLMVDDGELVKVTIRNRSLGSHPFHLHGHHVTVLTKNGVPISGARSPVDSQSIGAHETWEIAFRADNPGLWMFHCHNLSHSSKGMHLMVAYHGVASPYTIGRVSGNRPS